MNKLRGVIEKALCFLMLFMLSGCGTPTAQTPKRPIVENPHVLLLSSYSYSWASIPYLLSGVSDTLNGQANIDYVFMDTKMKKYDDVKENVKSDIQYYADNVGKIDYVITADDDALNFVLEYQETLFKDIPVVFEGINSLELAKKAVLNPLITGIMESLPLKNTIDLARKINPGAKKIVGISDNTTSGLGSTRQFYDCQKYYSDITLGIMNFGDKPLEDFADDLSKLDNDTILIYLMVTEDYSGHDYDLQEGVDFVYGNVKIPIYKASILGIGNGIMGGVVVSFYDMACEAARIILDVSYGSDISKYELSYAPYSCIFDKRVMDQFGISVDKINSDYPGEVTYLNNPVSFFYANKNVIIPVIIILFLLVLVLLLAVIFLYKTKKTSKTIEEKDRSLNNILDNIPGAVIAFKYHIYTKRMELFYTNKGYVKSLSGGLKEAEKIKNDLERNEYPELLAKTSQKVRSIVKEQMAKGNNFKTVYIVSLIGKDVVISLSAVMTKKEDDCYIYYAVISDITNETKLQEKEKKAFELEASNKAKSDFLSVVSHDMRTPLNGIIGLSALMKGETSDLTLLSDISKLQVSADYLLTLVNDTLDMSKIDNGSFALHPIVCSSKEIFDSLKIVLQSSLDKKKMSIDFKVEKPAELVLFADRQRMTQVYMNIITNAIKYSKDGSSILVHVKRLEVGENYVRDETQVIDHGIGMSKEFIPHVFDPFSQERKNTAKQYEGTGLGMSITKKIVEKMHGKIKVESQLDVGTTVTFDLVLPIASKGQIKMTEEKSKETSSLLLLKGKRALIVDDQSLNAEIVKRLLDKQGIVSDIAYNGKEGLDKFSSSKPNTYDFILMDIRMPVMDGFEATEKIRALKRKDASKIKIIALTANAFYEDYQASKAISFDGYLAKPINPDDLLTMLISLLGL